MLSDKCRGAIRGGYMGPKPRNEHEDGGEEVPSSSISSKQSEGTAIRRVDQTPGHFKVAPPWPQGVQRFQDQVCLFYD